MICVEKPPSTRTQTEGKKPPNMNRVIVPRPSLRSPIYQTPVRIKRYRAYIKKKAKWESEKPEYKVDVDGINDDDDDDADDSRDAQQRNETSKQGPSL